MNRGFSLVELMVALLLAMVLLTGAGSVYWSTSKTYSLQQAQARLQDTGRTALDLLVRDIRMSAHTGCSASARLANALYSEKPDRQWMTHVDKGLVGIAGGSVSRRLIDRQAQSEALTLHWLNREQALTVVGHDSEGAQLFLADRHGANPGDLLALVVPGCDQLAVFIAGPGTRGNRVSHGAASATLANCSRLLAGQFNCMAAGRGLKLFDYSGALLAPVASTAYYIRAGAQGPALYRRRGGESVSGNRLAAEALVEGVERIRWLYGQDSDGDGLADWYRPAEAIGLFSDRWLQVTSVRIELLARSLQEVADRPQAYFFAGQQVQPSDRFVRRVFMATVELRNRKP